MYFPIHESTITMDRLEEVEKSRVRAEEVSGTPSMGWVGATILVSASAQSVYLEPSSALHRTRSRFWSRNGEKERVEVQLRSSDSSSHQLLQLPPDPPAYNHRID